MVLGDYTSSLSSSSKIGNLNLSKQDVDMNFFCSGSCPGENWEYDGAEGDEVKSDWTEDASCLFSSICCSKRVWSFWSFWIFS